MPEHPPARQGWDRATRPPVQHPALPAKPWKPAGLGKEYPAPTASLPMGEHGAGSGVRAGGAPHAKSATGGDMFADTNHRWEQCGREGHRALRHAKPAIKYLP